MEILFLAIEMFEQTFSSMKLFLSVYLSLGALFVITVLILTSENIRNKFHIK